MRKLWISAAVLSCATLQAVAGGLLTNTNQNAAFLRQMSQDAIIDLNGLYLNPAGTAFLSNGWHLGLNIQSAQQTRTIDTTFPLFKLNESNHNATHHFKGEASAPVIPSFQLSYNHDKWSVNASFALGGGGGKCEFEQGLGSFEALYAGEMATAIPGLIRKQINNSVLDGLMGFGYPQDQATAMADQIVNDPSAQYAGQLTGYDMNSYMRGRQYYFGLQLGATYKFMDNLAGFVGVRGVVANCSYSGYVEDVKASFNASYNVPGLAQLGRHTTANLSDTRALNDYSLSLNCDQSAFGVTPIIGIDFKLNEHWNFAAKYEFKTRMRLKNTSEMNNFAKQKVKEGNAVLGQFEDGKSVAEDIPAILNAGVQFSPISSVRINAGWHYYFDKDAKKYGDKHKLIDDNTMEFNAGAEWDCCKWVTVSASWQSTSYGLSDKYMNDLSFNLGSNSVGAGVRVHATPRLDIDLGYMNTIYKDRTVNTPIDGVGQKSDLYKRTNNVFGVGVNLHI